MKQCRECIFYDAEYDELRQSGDDIIIDGQQSQEKHYCRLYDQGIDERIITDKVKCERRMTK